MKYLYYSLFSLLIALISFIASNSLIVALIVFALGLIYFLLIFNKKYCKDMIKVNRFHECFNFVNNFIISLSVKDSLLNAFTNSTLKISDDFKKELESISHLQIEEKLKYLERYFYFDFYILFNQTILLFKTQGGNILDISKHLLNEGRNIEEYLMDVSAASKRKIVEISILWLFTLFILVFLRFGLSNFFVSISKEIFFKAGIVGFFVFFYVCFEVSRISISQVDISGIHHEKD